MSQGQDLIAASHDLETLPLDQRIEGAVAEAEARFEALQRITTIALRRTYAQDWIDFDGKPYLSADGCARIRPLFGITIDHVEVKRYEDRDQNGPYAYYVVTADAHFRGDTLSVMGTCSSRDNFFATRYVGGQKVLIPSEDVDQTNIVKSAYSNMIQNAVTRILGIRGLTWEQLADLGFDRKQASRVRFSGKTSEPKAEPGKAPDGVSWYTSLQRAIAEYTGGHHGSPAGLGLLQRLTAFKTFPGWRSWAALEARENREQVCQIAWNKLSELAAKEGRTVTVAPANGEKSAAPVTEQQAL